MHTETFLLEFTIDHRLVVVPTFTVASDNLLHITLETTADTHGGLAGIDAEIHHPLRPGNAIWLIAPSRHSEPQPYELTLGMEPLPEGVGRRTVLRKELNWERDTLLFDALIQSLLQRFPINQQPRHHVLPHAQAA